MEYAIVDIETTGGNASGSRITEIAIIIHNGKEVLQRFETLVNPEKSIPPAIFALTGITDDMVADAPIFEDIAEQVYSLLEGRVFVAHNVNFDYSFVRHQLRESGFDWDAKKLCTVRLCRKIKPGLQSYSLGNLCQSLGIQIQNRHRAGGDADATAILFTKLLAWDAEGHLAKMIQKKSKDQRLPPNLAREQFDALPESPGVYYFKNQVGKVMYIGKATNLKKRVGQHFSGNSIQPQRQHFLRDVFFIDYEVCATELMAFLLECAEIKKHWPPYNRALKRFEPKYGLIWYTGMDGYQYLAVGKLSKYFTSIEVFNKEYEARNALRFLVQKFHLDTRFCKVCTTKVEAIASAEGALPSVEEHNKSVQEALAFLETQKRTFYILDKGRNEEEYSCIWIEQGHLYGMGYLNKESQLSEPEDIRDSLPRFYGNHYMMGLVEAYMERHPGKVKFLRQGDVLSGTTVDVDVDDY